MTSIRSNATSMASSLNAASAGNHAADGNAASASASPFAALLQRQVDADGASRLQAAAPTPDRVAERSVERVRSPEPSPTAAAARPNGDQAGKPVEQASSRPAAKSADKTPEKAPVKSSDQTAARKESSKSADGDDAAKRRAAATDDPATADASADEAHGKPDATSATDPLAAWLAALQGGGQAAQAAPGAQAHGAAHAAAGQGGEAALQAVDEQAAALPAEARPGKPGAKNETAGDFAGVLAGAGRAAEAGNAPALGLAAVHMLGQAADGAALPGASQQTASLAEAVRATGGEQKLDATAQLAALGGLAGAATVHGHDAPTVAAPVGSPAFAGELADQVQVLVSKAALEAAAGSVHEARLNLNPVEMGPIAVRISLDGNQAQVDFAAASGATRQALQDSMPALASALHDAGLTLSGGGVSQEFAQARQEQARQPGGEGRASVASVAGVSGEGAVQDVSGAVANWLRRPEGRLDLYA
ncbi:flagellar hook-length control protein FliK [Aquabacterium sp.]|uniref:flagellar hook-length control protein FliK n=1 Tax=Aquabacterium sp. TaxID=1872578 RepID=UPI0035B0686B